MPVDVAKILEKNERLIAEKAFWNNHWQLVHEYFLQRKANFTVSTEQGAFLHSDIWTNLPGKAAETAASALLGLVWPDNHSFSLEPTGALAEDEETKTWFDKVVTDRMCADFDDPAAGLTLSLEEFMLDYLVSGTPAIIMEDGENSTYRFDARSVQQFAIEEGADGYVDTVYFTMEYTLRQAVDKYGLENLSDKLQKCWKAKKYTDKVKILHAIEPRSVDPRGGKGNKNMPIASYHIELESRHVIREGGYEEMPAFAARYSKRIGEKYGRSPAMRALPDVMELNALWEIATIGLEKNFDPPLGVFDDGTFGAGTIDTSAGAINVINVSGTLGMNNPIQQLYTVGSFNDLAVLIERLEMTINDHFMIDRLLDLDNEKEMTAREALIRQAIRQKALRSVESRLMAEIFDRMIERGFNMGLRKGRFGYAEGSAEAAAWMNANPDKDILTIPEAVVRMQGSGERVYKIRYMTPAAREQDAESAQGILNLLEVLASVSEIDETVKDLINTERTMKVLGRTWSVPIDIWSTEDELKQIREGAAAANEEAAAMGKAQMVAGIAKDAAMAQNAAKGSATRLQ